MLIFFFDMPELRKINVCSMNFRITIGKKKEGMVSIYTAVADYNICNINTNN